MQLSFNQIPPAHVASADLQSGTFALQHETPKTQARLAVAVERSHPLTETFTFWLTPAGAARRLTRYEIDMQRYAHVIIVSDDFKTFAHVHPELLPDGRFVLRYTFPRAGRYHLYADTDPAGIGQQVFRFDIAVDRAPGLIVDGPLRVAEAHRLRAFDGAYSITLNTAVIKAGEPSTLAFHIDYDGRPAEGLQPFLGAGAHIVLLNAADLTYDHTHPMPSVRNDAMADMTMSGAMEHMHAIKPGDPIDPHMTVGFHIQEPGTYKMWIQFNDRQNHAHAIPFVITAGS